MKKPFLIGVFAPFVLGLIVFSCLTIFSFARPVLTPARLSVSMGGIINTNWTPNSEPGLVSWKNTFSASSVTNLVDGSTLLNWRDLKSSAFDWTQTTSSKRPTFYTNQQGGHPLVFFDAIDDQMASPTQSINRVRTVFVVGKPVSGKNASFIDQGVNLSTIYTVATILYIYSGANGNVSTSSALPLNKCSGIMATFSGTLTAAYTNSVLCSGSVANGYTGTGTGVLYSGFAGYSHYLGEYMVYEGVLSAASTNAIWSYIRTNWSLP